MVVVGSPDSAVDVAIVGGGVAGSTLALVLARQGISVAVIERTAAFRDRVRGDALFPWGATEASRLGIADLLPDSGARPLPIWQAYEDRSPKPPYDWRTDVPTGDVAWGVNHPGLQETLLNAASDAGALVLRPASAHRPRRQGEAWVVPLEGDSAPAAMRARLVVGANGSGSGARRWLGAAMRRDPIHHYLGGCLLEGIDLDPDAAHLAQFDGGMTFIFRHASGLSRAYLVCQPETAASLRGPGARERFIEAVAAAFPEGALARARAVGPAAFFPAHDIFSEPIVGEGIMLLGDAAGANDPSRGQGLSLAFRDVRELSTLLSQAPAQDWQGAIEEFAQLRPTWYEPLRAHAIWQGPLVTDTGPEADAARARAQRAAELDPWRNGYGALNALGPEGLPVTEEARRHFLGEDFPDEVP